MLHNGPPPRNLLSQQAPPIDWRAARGVGPGPARRRLRGLGQTETTGAPPGEHGGPSPRPEREQPKGGGKGSSSEQGAVLRPVAGSPLATRKNLKWLPIQSFLAGVSAPAPAGPAGVLVGGTLGNRI